MATPKFLSHLRSLFSADSVFAKNSPYAYIAGIAFAALDRPQDVVAVYLHARSSNSSTTMTRVFREALFKTGVLYGVPRMINSLKEVVKVIPEEEKDTEPWRCVWTRDRKFVRRQFADGWMGIGNQTCRPRR